VPKKKYGHQPKFKIIIKVKKMFGKKEKTIEEIIQEKLERESIIKIELFPGSLSEYEAFKHAKYEIVDTSKPDKFLKSMDGDYLLRKEAYDIGAEAIIRAKISIAHCNTLYTGIPVKKVE
jgi:hypothetical protein